MAYDVGQRVRVDLSITDQNGALADTTLVVDVTRGDFTAYPAPAVVHDGLGLYHFDVDADVPGPWVWEAVGTTPVVAARSGQFFIRSSGARLLSLAEGKKYLNKDMVVTTDDDEILDLIDTATTLIEEIVGAIVPRTVTEVYDGGHPSIFLRQRAQSILTVTEAQEVGITVVLGADVPGVLANNDGYLFDAATNALRRRVAGSATRFVGRVTVVYVVGRAFTPPNFRTAAGELLSHVWRTSQFSRGISRPRTNETQDTSVVMGYAIPNRVRELLGTSKRGPRLGRV